MKPPTGKAVRAGWPLLTLLASMAVVSTGAAYVNPKVTFTSTPPNGTTRFEGNVMWSVLNNDGDRGSYDYDYAAGMTGRNVVISMKQEMELSGDFRNDVSVSQNVLTVDNATSGAFSASSDPGLAMRTPDPCPLPPGTTPTLPFGAVPPYCPDCPGGGVILMYLTDITGAPTTAGGNGTLTAWVQLGESGPQVFSSTPFSVFTPTEDILASLHLVFAAEPLPPGTHYAGIVEGALLFYTDDVRELSVGFSADSADSLNLVTSAAIYYPSASSTGILPDGGAASLRVHPNLPNPFRRATEIRFELGAPSAPSVRVYDFGGRLIRTLRRNDFLPAGFHSVTWDGTDDRGSRVPAGVYLYQLEAAGRRELGKMVIVAGER